MKETVTVLLVHSAAEPIAALRRVLERQSIRIIEARNCQEALEVLVSGVAPHVIFTETVLPDGTWERVLALASNSSQYTNVVVVSAEADIRLYIETVERGAWDFVAPPFAEIEITHVVRCAVENVHKRRAALAQLYQNFDHADGQERRAVWTAWGS